MQAVRKERDPLNLLTAYALNGNLATEDEFKVNIHPSIACWLWKWYHDVLTIAWFNQEIRKEVLSTVEEAVKFSLEGSELPTPELYTNVYVDQADMRIRGCDPFTWNY